MHLLVFFSERHDEIIDKEEFCNLTKDISPEVKLNCWHPEVVTVYTMDLHTDYGCLKCGFYHTNKKVFDKPGLSGWEQG